MDTSLGIVGKDFVLLATDAMAGRSIMVYKADEDKILPLLDNSAMAMAGPQGDRAHFGELIKHNIKLYKIRNGYDLSMKATANFIRNEVATSIRSHPYQINFLVGGVDDEGPSLYYIDYLGCMATVQYGAHGHASNFALSIFDRYYQKDMSLDECIDIFKKVIHELNVRFLISFQDWKFKLIKRDSIEEITIEL